MDTNCPEGEAWIRLVGRQFARWIDERFSCLHEPKRTLAAVLAEAALLRAEENIRSMTWTLGRTRLHSLAHQTVEQWTEKLLEEMVAENLAVIDGNEVRTSESIRSEIEEFRARMARDYPVPEQVRSFLRQRRGGSL